MQGGPGTVQCPRGNPGGGPDPNRMRPCPRIPGTDVAEVEGDQLPPLAGPASLLQGVQSACVESGQQGRRLTRDWDSWGLQEGAWSGAGCLGQAGGHRGLQLGWVSVERVGRGHGYGCLVGGTREATGEATGY